MTKTVKDVKNYWNSRPCNIKHSKKEIGSREYFNDVEHRKYFVEPHIPNLQNLKSGKEKKF